MRRQRERIRTGKRIVASTEAYHWGGGCGGESLRIERAREGIEKEGIQVEEGREDREELDMFLIYVLRMGENHRRRCACIREFW